MLEALAAVILFGLMFIPIMNIAVGAIAGFMLWGIGGAVGGALIGVVVTAWIGQKIT